MRSARIPRLQVSDPIPSTTPGTSSVPNVASPACASPTLRACSCIARRQARLGQMMRSAIPRRTSGQGHPNGSPVAACSCAARRSPRSAGLTKDSSSTRRKPISSNGWQPPGGEPVSNPGRRRATSVTSLQTRTPLEPIQAVSRVRFARKHHGRLVAALEASGVALGALVRAIVWIRRPARARGNLLAARAALRAVHWTGGTT